MLIMLDACIHAYNSLSSEESLMLKMARVSLYESKTTPTKDEVEGPVDQYWFTARFVGVTIVDAKNGIIQLDIPIPIRHLKNNTKHRISIFDSKYRKLFAGEFLVVYKEDDTIDTTFMYSETVAIHGDVYRYKTESSAIENTAADINDAELYLTPDLVDPCIALVCDGLTPSGGPTQNYAPNNNKGPFTSGAASIIRPNFGLINTTIDIKSAKNKEESLRLVNAIMATGKVDIIKAIFYQREWIRNSDGTFFNSEESSYAFSLGRLLYYGELVTTGNGDYYADMFLAYTNPGITDSFLKILPSGRMNFGKI